jgi:hypothetical protein
MIGGPSSNGASEGHVLTGQPRDKGIVSTKLRWGYESIGFNRPQMDCNIPIHNCVSFTKKKDNQTKKVFGGRLLLNFQLQVHEFINFFRAITWFQGIGI